MAIDRFFGPYRFLSNFWPAEVWIEGIRFPSVEHAYVAAKTTDVNLRRQLADVVKPGDVKRFGRSIELRPNWDRIKVAVMSDLLSQKFAAGTDLAAMLIATAPEELIEGNTWGDTFWGVCNGQGENTLGKLLMARRLTLIME